MLQRTPNGLAAPGRHEEFQEFASAFSPALLNDACSLLNDAYLAEDVVQETLMRTFRRWSRARAAPEAYSRVTLMNVCRDHWRRLRSRPNEVPADTFEARIHGYPDGWEHYWAERNALHQALRSLEARHQEVLIMRFILEFSVSETAEALGVAVGTVKSCTHRALEQLREALQVMERTGNQSVHDPASLLP